jgi:hypothetical protein
VQLRHLTTTQVAVVLLPELAKVQLMLVLPTLERLLMVVVGTAPMHRHLILVVVASLEIRMVSGQREFQTPQTLLLLEDAT